MSPSRKAVGSRRRARSLLDRKDRKAGIDWSEAPIESPTDPEAYLGWIGLELEAAGRSLDRFGPIERSAGLTFRPFADLSCITVRRNVA